MKLKIVFILVMILVVSISEYECARILCYFNIGLYSRQKMLRALTRGLAGRGHEVIVITPRPRPQAELVPNLIDIDVSSTPNDTSPSPKIYSTLESEKTVDRALRLKISYESTLKEVEQQFQSQAFQKIIREKGNYDVVIVEAMGGAPGLALSHIFNVPAIMIRPSIPYIAELKAVDAEMYTKFLYLSQDDISLWDAVNLLYSECRYRRTLMDKELDLEEVWKRNFGPEIPSVDELRKNVRAVLIHAHWLWDRNRPVPSNMVYTFNIAEEPQKQLPQDLQSYLDASENEVIFLSFGSIFDFSSLPEETMEMFLKVFSRLRYNVLLKCKKQLKDVPDNVVVRQWLPQPDVLRHPKVKLFITQGGIYSVDEAISAGVPMLVIPMFNDQWLNAEQCVKFKIGIKVDVYQLTEELLLNAINTVTEDPSYAAATHRFREQCQRPFVPMERALLTVERVLRGAALAQPQRAREQHPELPLLAVAALVLLALLIVLTYLIKLISTALKKVFNQAHMTYTKL